MSKFEHIYEILRLPEAERPADYAEEICLALEELDSALYVVDDRIERAFPDADLDEVEDIYDAWMDIQYTTPIVPRHRVAQRRADAWEAAARRVKYEYPSAWVALVEEARAQFSSQWTPAQTYQAIRAADKATADAKEYDRPGTRHCAMGVVLAHLLVIQPPASLVRGGMDHLYVKEINDE